MKLTCAAIVFLIQTLHCLASDDSPFQLTNKATGFCLVKINNQCSDIRWTTGDRLLVQEKHKCLGVPGKSVGSEVSLYDCDENSELQKWECWNGTLLSLKDQELYIELTDDSTAVLSKITGPNNHLTITGTSSGACTRTYRELYSIGGNAAGMLCMFPFQYKDQWFSDCVTLDSSEKRLWCAVETKYQNEQWGYCPVTSKDGWNTHPETGAHYQINMQSALTWPQAETSCRQQGASLLSITDPHQQDYVAALVTGGSKFWTGLILDPEHGWKWSNGRPYRYTNWYSGHRFRSLGYNCAFLDLDEQSTWQSLPCDRKLGYICYSDVAEELPTQAVTTGFCARPWIPFNGRCFYSNRTQVSWADAQTECHHRGGDLVSIHNVHDQSFVISQLGYESFDTFWIGLNDKKTEGLFDWSDHSPVRFTSWEFGKPGPLAEIKDCVLIKGEHGNWADHGCDEKHGFICMRLGVPKPTGDEVELDVGCKPDWRRHGSYCYFIGRETKTFDEAKDVCMNSDSYLADVSNGLDNAFLISLTGMSPEKYFWLGLSNQQNINEFEWTNKDTVSFTHWNTEMPGHLQGCVAMQTGIFAGLWDVLPCSNQEKYICKHLAEKADLTTPPSTVTPLTCDPDGWIPIPSRRICYKMFVSSSTKRTWYDARDYCKAIGGDLLSIHSTSDIMVDIHSYYSYESLWIGLSAPDPVTGYVWSDGSPLQYQNWKKGEPNNKNNVESCVVMKTLYKTWADKHCDMYRGWLCQIRAGVTPRPPPGPVAPDYNTTSDGWLEWKGNHYYINTKEMHMEAARHFCHNRHSDLVTVNSEAEGVFLWKRISRSFVFHWIGLTVDLDGTYEWMDGSPMVFQRWDQNQPLFLKNDENCAIMTSASGFWHADNCGHQYRSICKRSSIPLANATVATRVPPSGGCEHTWKKSGSKCYKVFNKQMKTWDGARAQCNSTGGNLATIISRSVQVLLTTSVAEAPATDLWIGLHSVNDGPFYWTDGHPMTFTNWRPVRHYEEDRFEMGGDFIYEVYDDDVPDRLYKHECAAMTSDIDIGIGLWTKKYCEDSAGYICQKNVDPSLPDSPEPTPIVDYVTIFNDSVKVNTQPMTWYEAEKYCEQDGAKLANLENQWTKAHVELMALNHNAPLWIGLNKIQSRNYFTYTDGRHVTTTHWDWAEPNAHRHCVYMDLNLKWKTADCNESKRSVCMKSTDEPPPDSNAFPGVCPNDDWLPFKGYCYVFVKNSAKWPEASIRCIERGGTLLSIEDPAEQNFVKGQIKRFEDNYDSVWIGFYKTHQDTWQWLDKKPMVYVNYNENNMLWSTYGTMKTRDGTWSTGSLLTYRPFVCKAPKVLLAVSSTAANPTLAPQTTHNVHIILAAVLVMMVIVFGTVIIIFIFKKSGHYRISNEPEQVDINRLIANEEEENPQPV